jgi:hypothetical protein
VSLELTQAEWENLTETSPLKLESARRLKRQSAEDLAQFEKIGRGLKEKSATYNLKGAEQRLEGAKEELTQLEKMYKADDLTEETEEIILKRQRFAVEFAQFGLESARQNAEQSLKTSIPREYETLKNLKRDQELALTLAEQTLPKALEKKKLDLEKAKRDSKKSEKKLADLKRDLELATVRAPMDGIVYYGACENGKWVTGGAMTKKLLPSGKLTANEVFMTVVNPERLVLKAIVPEADLPSQSRPGRQGIAGGRAREQVFGQAGATRRHSAARRRIRSEAFLRERTGGPASRAGHELQSRVRRTEEIRCFDRAERRRLPGRQAGLRVHRQRRRETGETQSEDR